MPLVVFASGLAALIILGWALGASSASAAPSVAVPPYGEVTRFGGLDTGASFGTTVTTGLKSTGEAKFVDPLGMVVDTADPSAPGGYAIYVLDNVNPQVLNGLSAEAFTTLALEYRIQKISDTGEILASRAFTLESSATEPGQHAVSLALDAADDRVYALIMDAPPTPDNEGFGRNAVDRVDAWTTGRHGPALAAAAEPKKDEELASGQEAGELAGPATLQAGKGGDTLDGDVDGESIATDTTAGGVEVAVGGNQYSEGGEAAAPAIELIQTAGAHEGTLDAKSWKGTTDVEATEDNAARIWGSPAQQSINLFSLSADPDGSLNVALGNPEEVTGSTPDEEPNMASVSPELTTTSSLLPWASAADDQGEVNFDRAATVQFAQDHQAREYRSVGPDGATRRAGTLAPSVVQLAGDGSGFPEDLYAGLVVQKPVLEGDRQNPAKGSYAWEFATSAEKESEFVPVSPSSLAVRVFDAQGESLAMVGNLAAGACNLQGGPYGEAGYNIGSFVALAPGREGAFFALAQTDLDSKAESRTVSPGTAIGGGLTGDEVVEFAPGAGQAGAAGQACPQPSGGITVTNETQGGAPSTGSAVVTVATGTKVQLDASQINLAGGTPWSYEWLSGEEAHNSDNSWLAEDHWLWPSPTTEFTYTKPGSYTAKLNLVNDFGTLAAQRTINVVQAVAPTACFHAVSAVAGEASTFDASCSHLPEFDSAVAYHWEFGDETGESQAHAEAQHVYATAGSYTVKLTITDALKQTAQAQQTIVVTAKATAGGGGAGGGISGVGTTTAPGGTTNPPSTNVQTVNTSPTNVNPRVATIASAHGTVAVQVSCPTGKASCAGTISLTTAGAVKATVATQAFAAKRSKKRGAATVKLGTAAFKLPGGTSETVQVRLSSKALALLRKQHSVKVIATITASDPGGHAHTVTEHLTLRAARPVKAKRPKTKHR